MKELELGQAMKEGMRRLASGVAVISSRGADGYRTAMTATSVTSVSDSPASLLVCVNRSTSLHKVLVEGANFSVNILSNDQQNISNHCSRGDQGENRFTVGDWQEAGEQRTPYLNGSLVAFVCKQVQTITFGTHDIVIGEIQQVMIDDKEAIDPLVYLNGGYRTCS